MITRLEKLKILQPLGDAKYDQQYIYADYYEIFDESFREARKREKSYGK